MADAFETILVAWLAFAFLPERPTRSQGGTGHERFGERLHTYSFWTRDQARAVAKAADAAFAAGVSTGPLQGLPVSIKDLFAAAGYPCFAGSSRRLPAYPWERDGPLVATLRRQLGVITGHIAIIAGSRASATLFSTNNRVIRSS
jgi:hypothetical protein